MAAPVGQLGVTVDDVDGVLDLRVEALRDGGRVGVLALDPLLLRDPDAVDHEQGLVGWPVVGATAS